MAGEKIRVNCVAPGLVITSALDKVPPPFVNPHNQTNLQDRFQTWKKFVEAWEKSPDEESGKPEEIANEINKTLELSIYVWFPCLEVIRFFSTDDSSFVTGQVLYVDGGYSIRGLGY